MRRFTDRLESWFPILVAWIAAITLVAAIVAALLGPAD